MIRDVRDRINMPCNLDVMVDGRFPDDFPDALKETWRNIGHVTPS